MWDSLFSRMTVMDVFGQKRDALYFIQKLMKFIHVNVELGRDLLFGRVAPQPLFQGHAGFLHNAAFLPQRPGHPVHGAYLVEHSPFYADFCVILEWNALAGVVFFDGVDQPQDPGAHEVFDGNVVRQPRNKPQSDILDQVAVFQYGLVPVALGCN